MVGTSPRLSFTRRRLLTTGAAALGTAAAFRPGRAPAQGGAKPFQGTTLNVSCWSAPYPKWLADYIPEFEEQTGIKVNYDTPAFGLQPARRPGAIHAGQRLRRAERDVHLLQPLDWRRVVHAPR